MNRRMSLKKKYIKKQVNAVLKLLMLFLATLSVFVVGAWSWFNDSSNADSDSINMTLSTIESLEVSVNNSEFSTHINLSDDTDILENLNMRDVTGFNSGFLIPKFKNDIGISDLDLLATWDNAVPNQHYISLTLVFRTEKQSDIYVASGTKVLTYCEKQGASLSGADAVNKSDFGDFSRDAIVGALRMNAFDSAGAYKFLWIPRPDIYLQASADHQRYQLNTNLSLSEQHEKETLIHTCYNTNINKAPYECDESKNVITSESAFTANAYDDASGNPITKIATTSMRDGDYYVSQPVTFNIWLEGCDAEALRALSGGKYEIALNFIAKN